MKAKLNKFILWSAFLVLLLIVTTVIIFYVWTKQIISTETPSTTVPDNANIAAANSTALAFPVGVNSHTKTITENPTVDFYAGTNLSINSDNSRAARFLDRLLAEFVRFDWYQNLASSVSRILVIYPGERHEEVVKNIGDILRWNSEERELFFNYVISSEPALIEGKFYPGRYVVSKDATPEEVADLLIARFNEEILARYPDEIQLQVPLADYLSKCPSSLMLHCSMLAVVKLRKIGGGLEWFLEISLLSHPTIHMKTLGYRQPLLPTLQLKQYSLL